MHSEPVFLTIDIGTSMIKSTLLGISGVEITSHKVENRSTLYGHNTAECDMALLWELCCSCIAQAIKQAPEHRNNIAAVCIAGNMIGLWMLDRENRPFTNAILWNDGRSVEVIKGWRSNGISDAIFDLSGNALTPGFTLPLLKWSEAHCPENLDRCGTILFCKDYIRYCLTSELATEETDASHAPGSLTGRDFSEAIFHLCGLDAYVPRLPPVLKSGDCAGHVTKEAAEQTGLPLGTPVLAGMCDVSAMLTGAGSMEDGALTLVLGTSCLCNMTVSEPALSPRGIGLSFLLPEGRYIRALPNQTGTVALNWFVKEFIQPGCEAPIDWAELEAAMAKQIPDGSDGLIFHPYLNSTGVIAPVYQPEARGRIWGLRLDHTRLHLLKALYEGLGYAVADCIGQMPPGGTGPIRAVGGGANSPYLCQLIADITGRPLQTLQNDEIGALGLTMLCGIHLGEWANLSEAAAALLTPGRVYTPSAQRHAFYLPRLAQYQLLRSHLAQEYEGGTLTE